ncbi:MAG TPA: CoB--CoM heterodisulfide reductase iron-sulfur subunit A family protein [Sunxiuqinia sp.]|nr:CoB--CoM heterodisulfide reductase iron-sulfur subunit A family protein [Sunxiuqinia sp.]
MKKKIGVYICHCGGNISDYVDVEKVRQEVENEEGIALAKTTMFACADSNQKEMVEDIKNNELDGVVVASCSPKLHLITFRAVTERAGLNKYNYVHANIREQGSWAHSDDKIGATEKAIKLVKASIAKVRYAESLEPIKIPSQKAIAVIGGGVAGMRAAIELSDMKSQVYLIEREPFTGGRIAQWDVLFTSDETGKNLATRLYTELKQRDNVTIFTNAEVVESAGSIGDFKLKIKITPRYIREHCIEGNLQKAIEVCPVEVPDAFNFNITSRKAIYHNYPGEHPHLPVIDLENCTRCGECEKVCPSIDFSQQEEVINIHVGSVLVATGYDPYTPKEGEFGYQQIDNVVTLPQFKRLVALNDKKLVYQGKEIQQIAYIYCVGSRQPDGENKYCSRYCCTSTIHAAIHAKKKFSNIQNYHFNRGIRTYGKQEVLYADSSRQVDIYLQSYEDALPQVSREGNQTIVRINDILTNNKEIEVEADLVVLVTGMVPRAENSIGSLLKLPKGRDKFFNEIHMKLRPVETVIDGITIAGTCQGPKNVMESVNSALSAATKSYSYISKGQLELEPIVAEIDPKKCDWCDACSQSCPYDAIKKVGQNGKAYAVINNSVCKGCGMCLPVCPTDAIDLLAYSNREIESMIDALAND